MLRLFKLRHSATSLGLWVGRGKGGQGYQVRRRQRTRLLAPSGVFHCWVPQLSAVRCGSHLGGDLGLSGSVWGLGLGLGPLVLWRWVRGGARALVFLSLAMRRLRRRASSRLTGRYQGGNIPSNLQLNTY
jgi:hypothetical protein